MTVKDTTCRVMHSRSRYRCDAQQPVGSRCRWQPVLQTMLNRQGASRGQRQDGSAPVQANR